MVSPQIVFTYPLHRAKLQVLLKDYPTNSEDTKTGWGEREHAGG